MNISNDIKKTTNMKTMGWEEGILTNIAQKIHENRVVPIIGPGAFEAHLDDGKKCSVHEYLVNEILAEYSKYFEEKDRDISLYITGSLIGMTRLSRKFEESPKIKKHLVSVLNKIHQTPEWMNHIVLKDEVKTFLINGRFPLVLTTCIYPGLQSLITYKCREYNISIYRKETNADIPDNPNETPCIFYLLGGVGFNTDTTSVITDNDFLSYIHGYLGENQPKKLKTYLNNRYLLTLGCEIPSWTFRFLLYSLKVNKPYEALKDSDGDDETFVGGAVSTSMEAEISEFLEDINYISGEEITSRLTQINSKLERYKPQIFLSMSSTDYKLGESIQNKLEENDMFAIWFFPTKEKDAQYWNKIKDGIKKSDFFVPVITSSLMNRMENLKEINKESYDDGNTPGFIVEWGFAAEHKKELGDKLYSAPLYIADNEESKREMMNLLMSKLNNVDKNNLIKPSLFPEDGAEAIESYSTDTLNPEEVWNHFKLLKY